MSDQFKAERQKEISENKIVIYGKGTKLMPMCGFTGMVLEIVRSLEKPFHMVNILENEEIRSGMKEFSNWPTFPQVYVDGEFVGGCDIVREMHENGELQQVVEKAFEA